MSGRSGLVRVRQGRLLGGVCGGIARRLGWSPLAVRAAFVLSCILPGPQFILYIVLWIVLPEERS